MTELQTQPAVRMGAYDPRFFPTSGYEVGVWYSRKMLMVMNRATLPHRCIKCNAPITEDERMRMRFTWHPPGYWFLILLNPIIYMLVALMVRQVSALEFGLCEDHLARRTNRMAIGWVVAFSGLCVLGLGFTGLFPGVEACYGIGPLITVLGLFLVRRAYTVMHALEIQPFHILLKGAGADFLMSLPVWNHQEPPDDAWASL